MNAHRKLHIKKAHAWRPSYHMREGDATIATLELANRHGSRASAIANDFTLSFHQTKFFPKEIQLHDDRRGALHTFHAQWNSKGSIDLAGKKYFWLPANKMWTAWKWQDGEGKILMRLEYNPFRPFTVSGKISAHPDISPRELKYLGLLGWYLLLLDFELPGSRILNAMELAVRRLRKRAST
jgi:hypothetical protein